MTELREVEILTPVRAGEAQVWRVEAALAAEDGWRFLLPDEVERARGVRMSVARNEFVAGRSALRQLLGRELGCKPREVRLKTGAHGKPIVAGLEFNVAHSRGVVMIALSRAGVVGIDVEREDRTVEALDIGRASFHPEEIRWLEQAAEGERAGVFFRCWTRKEAVAKADGRGLSLSLDSFSVRDSSEEGREKFSGLEEVRVDMIDYQGTQKSYYLRDLDCGAGVAGALAFARPGVAVTMHEITASNQGKQAPTKWALPGYATSLPRVTS